MKKILVLAIALVMVISVLPFTVSADDGQVDWSVFARATAYEETYDKNIIFPGYKYTTDGVQVYSPSEDVLKSEGQSAFSTIQTATPIDITNGVSMTATLQSFDSSNADKWICFSVWTQPNLEPPFGTYGNGWFCLIRPNASGAGLESFFCTSNVAMSGTPGTSAGTTTIDIYSGGEIGFEFVRSDDEVKLILCGEEVDYNFKALFDEYFPENEAYIGVSMHNATYTPQTLTVTGLNGVKPQGTSSQECYVPEEMVEPGTEDSTLPVEAGKPCILWDPAEDIKNSKPGQGMSSVLNDDGSATITFTEEAAPCITYKETVANWYRAETFPIFAVKFKDIDEIAGSFSFWYCAGEVIGPRNDSVTTGVWGNCDYDYNDEENGWAILTIDLSYETMWEERINGFRVDFCADNSLAGQSFDIAWMGFFRTEEDAYRYAELGDTWDAYYGEDDDEDETTEAPADTNEGEATTEAPEDSGEPEATTAAPAGDATTNAPSDIDKDDVKGMGAWLWIVIGVAAVAAVAVIIVVIKKKK